MNHRPRHGGGGRPEPPAVDPSRNPKVMKIAELAEYLHVHKSTIYRLLRRHELPAFKIGSDWRFNLDEIDAWRLKLSGQVLDTVVKRPSSD
jgi:excisionase family DNA binding protein